MIRTGVCLIGFSMGAAAQGDKAQRKEKVLSILQAALGPEARSEALIYTEMEWPGHKMRVFDFLLKCWRYLFTCFFFQVSNGRTLV